MDLKTLETKFVNELVFLYQEDEIKAMFLIALEHYLNINRASYILKKHTEIDISDLTIFEQLLTQLKNGKPIQYIIGETNFYGLTFKVNPSVLIPRPETEELVAWILEKTVHQQPKNLLDIGTGSGCIPISLKKNLRHAEIYAIDISADALKTAKQNAALNNVEVNFMQADILNWENLVVAKQFDVIVSNPPYITESEKLDMHQNVLANEPHLALFVSNDNPLSFYEAIANFAIKNLAKDGLLFFEINEYLGEQTVSLLEDKMFKNIELRKDMQGKDRMICCENPN